MSKFIDKLTGLERRNPSPLGFGAASGRDKPPAAILLVGKLTAEHLDDADSLKESRVDAFLLDLPAWEPDTLDTASKALGDIPWGVRVPDLDAARAETIEDKGGDFVVFEAEGTAAAVLSTDELGKVIEVGPGMTEDDARGLGGLATDAGFLSPEVDLLPLTVRGLMDIVMVRNLISGPFVLETPVPLESNVLEVLRDGGISALLVSVASLDAVAETAKAIEDLAPQKRVRGEEWSALAPQPRTETAGQPAQPDHDHDHDDPDDFEIDDYS